jgi:DNA replication protein DnaC
MAKNEQINPGNSQADSRRCKKSRAQRIISGIEFPPPLAELNPGAVAERAARSRLDLISRGIEKRFVDLIADQLDSRLPRKYVEMMSEVMIKCREKKLVTIGGPRGRGKTAMACMIARDFHERGRFCHYTTATRYLNRIGQLMRQGGLDRFRDSYERADLVIVDEVQERRGAEFLEAEFISLIDTRYAKTLPTILITNLLPDQFAENVGDSIHRRLVEEGGFLVADWERIQDVFDRQKGLGTRQIQKR